MIQPMGNFLNCAKLINHCPDIKCYDKAGKHYKSADLPKVKPFATLHRHVNQVYPAITSGLHMHKS